MSERSPHHTAEPHRATGLWQPVRDDSVPANADTLRLHYRRAVDDLWSFPVDWLAGDFHAEDWYMPGAVDSGQLGDWQYLHCTGPRGGFAMAALQRDDAGDNDPQAPVADVGREAYRQLFDLQRALGLPHAGRIWHWLSSPTVGQGQQERYREFCRGRAEAIDTHRHASPDDSGWPQLPPATLVASGLPGLRLHAILLDTPIVPIENPRQVSAYRYPAQYGPRAPAFARGGIINLGGQRSLLISGTASIVGHESRHPDDLPAQFHEALRNVAAVIDSACPGAAPAHLQCVKVYLRYPDDAAQVQHLLAEQLPGVPCVLAHAPLCRSDLLLELEGQMLLAD